MVTLSGKGGTPLAEVADDLVTATRLDQAGAEPLRWREVEVEAAQDGPAAAGVLRAAGQALVEAGARPSASASELGRLLGTSSSPPRAACRAERGTEARASAQARRLASRGPDAGGI